jgi:hydrogenase maturation protease
MMSIQPESAFFWIIGYGNTDRQDDGIGPYVVERLDQAIKEREGIRTLALHQLGPEWVEDVRDAHTLILVDACQDWIEYGWQWVKIEPELRDISYLTHHLKPSFFVGLLHSLYQHCPESWLISIQGQDFGFGKGLSIEAQKRADKIISQIVQFVHNRKE